MSGLIVVIDSGAPRPLCRTLERGPSGTIIAGFCCEIQYLVLVALIAADSLHAKPKQYYSLPKDLKNISALVDLCKRNCHDVRLLLLLR